MGISLGDNFCDRSVSAERSVLLVDDEPAVRVAIARALSRQGFTVLAAEDGFEALRLADTMRPRLAIIDRQLPGMDGLSVVRRLKSLHGPSVHAIVLSGFHGQTQRIEAFNAGADDFVPKPFSAEEIVERVRAAQRVQLALAALREAQQRADRHKRHAAEASALLAHDLNNGLAIALANLEFVTNNKALGVEDADAVSASIRALKRMACMVANFTDIARMEDGVLRPMLSDCLVHGLLNSAAEVHVTAPDGPRLRIECDPDLVGRFDMALVERILHNLLGNAARYAGADGKIWLRAREASATNKNGSGSLIIEVANTGPEIPLELQERIFEKYSKGNDSRAVRGMGLYFCRLACEAHNGRISVESGGGRTVFTIRLPGAAQVRLPETQGTALAHGCM